MLTADQVQLCKDIGYGVALGGFQAYNIWNHRKNLQRIKATNAKLTITYDDVKSDLETMYATLESITVKLNGGDRRKARSMPNVDAAVAADQRRRWTDPRQPRPTAEGAT